MATRFEARGRTVLMLTPSGKECPVAHGIDWVKPEWVAEALQLHYDGTAAKAEASATASKAEQIRALRGQGLTFSEAYDRVGRGESSTEIDVTEDEVAEAVTEFRKCFHDRLDEFSERDLRAGMRAALEAALRKRRELGIL